MQEVLLQMLTDGEGSLALEPMALKDIQSNALIGSSKIGDFFIYKIVSKKNEAFLCSILPIEGSNICKIESYSRYC